MIHLKLEMMKKFLFIAAMVLMSGQAMQAQNRTHDRKPLTTEQRVERSVKRMTKELSLTEEQIQKITTLYQDFFKTTEGLSRGDEKIKEARQKLEEGIKAVLTEEQQTLWNQTKNRQRPQKPQGGSF